MSERSTGREASSAWRFRARTSLAPMVQAYRRARPTSAASSMVDRSVLSADGASLQACRSIIDSIVEEAFGGTHQDLARLFNAREAQRGGRDLARNSRTDRVILLLDQLLPRVRSSRKGRSVGGDVEGLLLLRDLTNKLLGGETHGSDEFGWV